MEPATNGWRRSATSGLRGRAEVRSRYADLLAPVSPAIPPPTTHPGEAEAPASAPPFPYEGDLPGESARAWGPSRTADRPPAPLAAERPFPSPSERLGPSERSGPSELTSGYDPYPADPYHADPYHADPYHADPYHADPYHADPYHADPYHAANALTDPAFNDLPALAQAAAAASRAAVAAQAASAGVAAAEAKVSVEDRAAVQAAYQAAASADLRPPLPTVNGTRAAGESGLPPEYRNPPQGLGGARGAGQAPVDYRTPGQPPADPRNSSQAPVEYRTPPQATGGLRAQASGIAQVHPLVNDPPESGLRPVSGMPAPDVPPPAESRAQPSAPVDHQAPGAARLVGAPSVAPRPPLPGDLRPPPGDPRPPAVIGLRPPPPGPQGPAEFRPLGPPQAPAEFRPLGPPQAPAEFRPLGPPQAPAEFRPLGPPQAPAEFRPLGPPQAPAEFRPPGPVPAGDMAVEPAYPGRIYRPDDARPTQGADPAEVPAADAFAPPASGPVLGSRPGGLRVVRPLPAQGPATVAATRPVSAAPVSAAPISGVPVSAMPTSGVPGSGTPPLPQRVPAPPDVPEVPEDGPDDQLTPLEELGRPAELARIATSLRYKDDFVAEPAPSPDGFDFEAVLAAVRKVPGVSDAKLKPNETGVHTLRLDLDEGADPGIVSRLVARLLKQKMGLAAEPRRVAAAARVPAPPGVTEASSGPVAEERLRHRHPVTPSRGRGATEGRPEEGELRRPTRPGTVPRVVLDQVQVSTLGMDATVQVRLSGPGAPAVGVANGPAVDGYVLRLAAEAATNAIDQLLARIAENHHGRSYVEHAAVVPFGSCEVAVVVILMVGTGSQIEQLTGSALVSGDPRQAVVRATLAAVNRRLDALLGG